MSPGFWKLFGLVASIGVAWLFNGHLAMAAEWEMDKSTSTLEFASETQGERFTGKFGDFTASIRFDPAQLADAHFDVTVALASADTANSERDEALKGEDFFAVEQYSSAHYEASQFTEGEDGGFVAEGELTLHGITQKVPLAFTWKENGDSATLEGHATLDRTAFGLGTGDWADPAMLAHEVEVTTRLTMQRISTDHSE